MLYQTRLSYSKRRIPFIFVGVYIHPIQLTVVAMNRSLRDLLNTVGLEGNEFAGRTILITGAAGGIGQPVSEACAELGAQVALTDIQPIGPLVERLVARGAMAIGMSADLTEDGAPDGVVDWVEAELGRVDVFVHLAADAEAGPMFGLA